MLPFAPIPDISPSSRNLLNPFWNFNNGGTWTKTGTGTAAFVLEHGYDGGNILRATNTAYNSSNDLLFYPADSNAFWNVDADGQYFLSGYFMVDPAYEGESIPVRINVFIDAAPYDTFEFILGDTDSGFVFGKWNRFGQSIEASDTEVISFNIEVGYDNASSFSSIPVNMSGFKLQLEDKQGIPGQYSRADEATTGWIKYNDTAYTSGAPLAVTAGATVTLPNNAGNFDSDRPTRVLNFYNAVSNKFLRDNSGSNMGSQTEDYDLITISGELESTQSQDAFAITFEVNGTVIGQKNVHMLAASGTPEWFSVTFPVAVTADMLTHGILPKITATAGDLSVYDISFEVSQTHQS